MADNIRQVANVLITGATSGIGLEIANKLVIVGKNVVVTGRCPGKLEVLKQNLNGMKVRDDQEIRTFLLDMGKMSTVAAVMPEICKIPLDTVILNAGTMFPSARDIANDDRPQLEETLKVNVLGHFLMVRWLLKNPLKKIHFVCISSTMAEIATRWNRWPTRSNEFPSFFSLRNWFADGWFSYFDSKLAAIVISQWISKNSDHDAIAIHPGVSRTAITNAIPAYQQWILSKIPEKHRPPMESAGQCASRVIDEAVTPVKTCTDDMWICDGHSSPHSIKAIPPLTQAQKDAFIHFIIQETEEFC